MRIIGKIRNNTWLLIVMLGLGMLAFLLMDMIGNNSIFNGGGAEVGSVNGTSISQKDFFQKEQAFFANSGGNTYQQRENLWNYLVQQTLVEQESESLGLSIPSEELKNLFVSPDPRFRSPVVENEFGGRNGFDLNNVQKIMNEIRSYPISSQRAWKNLEERVELDHTTNKLNTLVAKSMYTPSWLAEEEYKTQNQKVGMKVVSVPFGAVEDDLSVSDDEIKKYMAANAFKYTNEEETRDIEYVAVEIIPSQEDSIECSKTLKTELSAFATTDNDSIFVKNRYGVWDDAYFTSSQISPDISNDAMTLPVGSIMGPYIQGAEYKGAKIIDRMVIADSVKARHIFVPKQNNPNYEPIAAGQYLDSIRSVLNAGGTTFEDLIAASGPPSGNKYYGQDLKMVHAQSDLGKDLKDQILFNLPKGQSIINTQFGTHLIDKISTVSTGVTGVKLAYISKSILPSDITERKAIDLADDLIAKNRTLDALKKAVAANSALSLSTASGLTKTGYKVGDLTGSDESARNITKWAFLASPGKISPDVYTFDTNAGEDIYTNKLVVVGLANVARPGLASVGQYRDAVSAILLNEKRGEMLQNKLKGKSMDDIAAEYESSIQEVNSDLSRPYIGNSREDKVVAAAMAMSPNTTSQPIVGENGVYVVEVTSAPTQADIEQAQAQIPALRKQMSAQASAGINTALFEAMKKAANISDNRGTVY